MSGLSNNFPIKSLLVPGTHNSAAWQSQKAGMGLVVTQNLNFLQQMDNGIRFFDLRVSEKLNFFHNKHFLSTNMGDFVKAAKSFLASNPTEGLIIQVKAENCSDKRELGSGLCSMIKADKNLFIWGSLPTTLSQIRGRILILLRGVYYTPSLVLNYTDNELFDVNLKKYTAPEKYETTINGSEQSFLIQDCYDVYDARRTAKQRAERKAWWISQCHAKGRGAPNKWVINFFSHKGLAMSASIEEMSKLINGYLDISVGINDHGFFPMDFPNKYGYIDRFIDVNYVKNNAFINNAEAFAALTEEPFPEPIAVNEDEES